MNSYLPLLRLDHTIPFELDRLCPGCRTRSLYVNFTSHFYLKCLNFFCPRKHVIEPLACFFEHREYALTQMSVKFDSVLVVGPDGTPNFDYPTQNPTLQDGPYRNCPGLLEWDRSLSPSRDTTLICPVCKGQFHTMIFASYGIAGEALHHSEFRVRQTGSKFGEVVSQWSATDRTFPLQTSVALLIDKAVWNGVEIRAADTLK